MILLLGLIFAFLVPGMRVSILGFTRAEIQQEALRAINAIARDIEVSASGGISLVSTGSNPEAGPVRIGIVRAAGVDPVGNRQWEDRLIVYSWERSGKPLIRKEWTTPGPPMLAIPLSGQVPVRAAASDLSAIADEPGLQAQFLARDVSELSITSPGGLSSVSTPVTLSITIKRQAATGRKDPEMVTFTRIISLRNQI